MRDDAHGIEEFAAEELHADDTFGGVDREVLLEEEQVVGEPNVGLIAEQTAGFIGTVEQVHARAAAALFGLDKRGPLIAPLFQGGVNVVEGERARMGDVECVFERGLGGFAEFQGERFRAVQHAGAAAFERAHERQSERDGARVAADVRGGAGLVEIERRFRGGVRIERGAFQIEFGVVDTAAFKRGEERLLPLGMFVEDDEIGTHIVRFLLYRANGP